MMALAHWQSCVRRAREYLQEAGMDPRGRADKGTQVWKYAMEYKEQDLQNKRQLEKGALHAMNSAKLGAENKLLAEEIQKLVLEQNKKAAQAAEAAKNMPADAAKARKNKKNDTVVKVAVAVAPAEATSRRELKKPEAAETNTGGKRPAAMRARSSSFLSSGTSSSSYTGSRSRSSSSSSRSSSSS